MLVSTQLTRESQQDLLTEWTQPGQTCYETPPTDGVLSKMREFLSCMHTVRSADVCLSSSVICVLSNWVKSSTVVESDTPFCANYAVLAPPVLHRLLLVVCCHGRTPSDFQTFAPPRCDFSSGLLRTLRPKAAIPRLLTSKQIEGYPGA